jgi:outer membrane lipoprotein-sorting protein
MSLNSRRAIFHSRSAAILLVLATLPGTGCLFRTRRVDQTLNTYNLKTATKQELVAYINKQAAQIQTMQATVDIDTAVGGARKGKITEYKEIRGYVLARKPAMLRMEGLLPIVRTRAFDMVSDGQQFKVWIPPKNRFVVGRNDVMTPNPQQPLENLRPQVIYDALLLREIDLQNEVAVLEGGLETLLGDKGHKYEQPTYVIDVIRGHGADSWISRKIVFNRGSLLPDRQLIYDESGRLVTDATYTNYKDNDAVLFPSRIEIKRPEEEYDITLNVVKLDLNKPLGENTFVLEQPQGVQVIDLDHGQASRGGGVH